MSAIRNTKLQNIHYDYLNHCDDACKHILNPYINSIERTLSNEHNNNPHYKIPFALKSICAAYYCQHLHYRLSFKTLFTQYPTNYHLLSGYHDTTCKHNWKSCPSIERITHILGNFQSYLNTQTSSQSDIVSPYVTFSYYNIKQILSDMHHIHQQHPQNMVKFYIRNKIIEREVFECIGICLDHRYQIQYIDSLSANLNNITNMEQWIKYNLFNIHQQLIHHSESMQQFLYAVNQIIASNGTQNVNHLLCTLRTVAKKLYKNDAAKRYRTLDTTNLEVQRRLLGFEGVLHFLSLLGFESNAIGTKLVCNHSPSIQVIRTAISVIDSYRSNADSPSIDSSAAHVKLKQTESKNILFVPAGNCYVEKQQETYVLDQYQNAKSALSSRNNQIGSSFKKAEFSLVSDSLQLQSSDTAYIDMEAHAAVALDGREENVNQKEAGGVMNWFEDKWKRMNANGRRKRKY